MAQCAYSSAERGPPSSPHGTGEASRMNARAVIDVSDFPATTVDHRSPIWWGNVLLLVVETVMFAILFAVYFYFRQNFHEWPPPRVNDPPVLFNPLPKLDA